LASPRPGEHLDQLADDQHQLINNTRTVTGQVGITDESAFGNQPDYG